VGPTIIACGFASVLLALLIPLANGPMWLRIGAMMASQFGGDAFGVAIHHPGDEPAAIGVAAGDAGPDAAIFRGLGARSRSRARWLAACWGGAFGIRPALFVAVAGYVLTPLFALFFSLRDLREIPEYGETPS